MSEKQDRDRIAECIVTVCGLGYLPIAPGTWGTLGAVVVHAAAALLLGTATHLYVIPALALLCSLACLVYGSWAERRYGRKDPSPFVLDEVAGYFLTVSFFPHASQLTVGIAAFFLFRLFDVIKPFPAGRSQRLPGGLGIVLDDLIAGLYAALGVWVVVLVIGR